MQLTWEYIGVYWLFTNGEGEGELAFLPMIASTLSNKRSGAIGLIM